VEITREQLRFQLGLATWDVTLKPEPMPTPQKLDQQLEALVDDALSSRPDIRATGFAITAANERVELAKRDYFGFVGILPDIKANGAEVGPGFQLNLPIFNQNQGVIARARADGDRLQAQRVHLCESAALEVRQSYLRYQQAYEDWQSWQNQVLPQADSAVESAQAALKEDSVSLIVVLESTRQSIDARRQAVDSQAQVRRAIAELERSLGRRIEPVKQPAEQIPIMLEASNTSETRVVR
jgi:outer membrane protein, heavy metal efflux system